MFPSNPNINDLHTEHGKDFIFNGEGWVLQSNLVLPDDSKWVNSGSNKIIPKNSKKIPSSIIDGLPLFGDIVTRNADEFATAEQGNLYDIAASNANNAAALAFQRANEANEASNAVITLIAEEEQKSSELDIIEGQRREAELVREYNEAGRNSAEVIRNSAEVIREQVKDATIIAKNEAIQTNADIQAKEEVRATAETGRVIWYNAAVIWYNNAVISITTALSNVTTAIGLSNTATQNANTAADLANEKAGEVADVIELSNTAISNANAKAILADNAATNANTVATNVANAEAARVTAGAELKTNKTSDIETNKTSVDKYPNAKGVVDYLAASKVTVMDSLYERQKSIDISKLNSYSNVILSSSDLANLFLTQSPTGATGSNIKNTIIRIPVVAGETIFLVGSTYCDSNYAAYGFANSGSVTGSIFQLGTIGIGLLSFETSLVVPAGATYIHLTLNANFLFGVSRTKRLTKNENDIAALQLRTEAIYDVDKNIPLGSGYYNIKTALTGLSAVTTDIRQISFNDGVKKVTYKYIGSGTTKDLLYKNWVKIDENMAICFPLLSANGKYINSIGIELASTTHWKKFSYTFKSKYYFEGLVAGSAVATFVFYEETHDITTGLGFLGYSKLGSSIDAYTEGNLEDYAVTYKTGVTADYFNENAKYIYVSTRYLDVNNSLSHLYKRCFTEFPDGYLNIDSLITDINDIDTFVETLVSPQIKNNTLPKKAPTETLKILYIGSSWMQDNAALVRNVAIGSSLNVKVGNWYRGSCTYQDMLNNFVTSETTYIDYNADGTNVNTNNFSIKDALLSDIWDIIMLTDSAQNQNYHVKDFIPEKEILRLVKMYAPNATIATYFGWVFQYNKSQSVWSSNLERCKTDILRTGVDIVVPTGIALWSMLSAYDDSTYNILYRNSDQTHLTYGFGRYIAACTNFVTLISPVFGVSILGNSYRCADVVGNGVAGDYTITEQQALDCQKFALSANSDRWNFRDMSSEI